MIPEKLTYIGQLAPGETCRMRLDCLKQLYPECEFTGIDTLIPLHKCPRLWRSIGWRYKIGPLIKMMNEYLLANLPEEKQDVIWVDKGIFFTSETMSILREKAEKLVHYTPDPAFTYHRSRYFFQSIPLYDYLITTKSFELDYYTSAAGNRDKVLYATQGYQANLHRPLTEFSKKNGVVFIGHYEKERGKIIAELIKNGIEVKLAGIKWTGFVKKYKCKNLTYLGNGLFGEDYVRAVSAALFGFGSISKWIPEKHTTRTFEIPACGTALLTEKNDEIATFFCDDEVIYYNDVADMIEKIKYYSAHRDELQKLTERGRARVIADRRDYLGIMQKLMDEIK